MKSKIVPFLWFDNNLEQTIRFSTGAFEDSKVLEIRCYDEAGPDGKTKVMTARFRLTCQLTIQH